MSDLANDPKYQIQIKHNNANDRFSKWHQIPNGIFKSPNDRLKNQNNIFKYHKNQMTNIANEPKYGVICIQSLKKPKMTDLYPTRTKWQI
jgi:hypothetical protein